MEQAKDLPSISEKKLIELKTLYTLSYLMKKYISLLKTTKTFKIRRNLDVNFFQQLQDVSLYFYKK